MPDTRPTVKLNSTTQTLADRIAARYPGRFDGYSSIVEYALYFTEITDKGGNVDKDKITEVNYGFYSADLFNWPESDEDPADYDERASARRYADLVEARLHETFPSAEITVDFQSGATGVLPYPLQARINGDHHHPELFVVEEIASQAYQDYDAWCVRNDAE